MHRGRGLLAAALIFTLSVGCLSTPVMGKNNMVIFTAKLTIKAGKEQEFETTMKGVVLRVRQESGNRAYSMYRSKDNPRVFLFFEAYVDEAALETHRQHFRELGVDLTAFLDGAPVVEFYEKVAS